MSMAHDPILTSWRQRRNNAFAAAGWAGTFRRYAAPPLAAILLLPLIEPVFFKFLLQDRSLWGEGLTAVSLRAGLLLIAVLSLEAYTALIRGKDRAVLSLLPVDPASATRLAGVRTLVETSYLPLMLCLLHLPLAIRGAPAAFALACVVVLGAWPLGVAAACAMHLLAVDVAQSPRAAPLLDMVRGNNPRAQAAFLYAPGAVLLVAGAAVVLASAGAGQVYAGDWTAAWTLAVPPALALLAWGPVPALARRSWFAASTVLADIDARYARLVDPEEARRVYLEGLVRFLPARMAVYALADLRAGWRAHRSWITSALGLGVAIGLLAWTADPMAPRNAGAALGPAILLTSTVGARLVKDEPDFLRVWLPDPGLAGHAARAWALLAWAQAVVLPAMFALAIRHGAAAGVTFWLRGLIAATGAAALVIVARGARGRAMWFYVPAAVLCAAAWAAWFMGGL